MKTKPKLYISARCKHWSRDGKVHVRVSNERSHVGEYGLTVAEARRVAEKLVSAAESVEFDLARPPYVPPKREPVPVPVLRTNRNSITFE
jgi:hypothetical protein